MALVLETLSLLDSNPPSEHCKAQKAMSGIGQCFSRFGHTEETVSMHKQQMKTAEKEGSVQERINASVMELAASRQPLKSACESLQTAVAFAEDRAGGDNKEIDEVVLSNAYFRLGVISSTFLQTCMSYIE